MTNALRDASLTRYEGLVETAMTWFKIDDKSAFHAKIVRAGNEAWGAVVRAGAWSSGTGTDGFIPDEIASMIAPAKIWERAEGCGKGSPGLVERVEGGWKIHDFLDWNPSAAEVAKKRADTRKRQENWRGRQTDIQDSNASLTRYETRDGRVSNGVSNAAPDPTRITLPTGEGSATAPPAAPLENPEPEAPRKARQAKLPAKPRVPVSAGWSVWREVYAGSRRQYGRYVEAPEDGSVMGKLVARATDEGLGELRARGVLEVNGNLLALVQELLGFWFKAYLRDDGANGFLSDNRHPLRCLPRSIPTYGSPWAKNSARQAFEEARGSAGKGGEHDHE